AMIGHGWQSQWKRVGRRLEEVRTVYTGAPGGTDAALDRVLSFFETIHHLKDWLRNDPKCGVTEDDVHEVIDKSPALQLCADIANGSKHFKLTSSQTGDFGTTIARNDVSVFPGTGTSAHRFYIESGGKDYDAREIAEQAVRVWEAYLAGRNML
ncbi:hypothetical protein, partial [Streptomyces swartbergensis]